VEKFIRRICYMKDFTSEEIINPAPSTTNLLEDLLREGARKMLQVAIEREVEDYLIRHKIFKDEAGNSLVYRNGYAPEREIQTGIGSLKVKRPRVDDRKLREELGVEGFTSEILPRFLRRVPSLNNLLPVLYLKGISTGDFPSALGAILGPEARNLSSNTIVRLKESWESEYLEWNKRDLSNKRYVYFWVDGIHMNVRMEREHPCILVIMAADEDGNKELLAISNGFGESTMSWKDILLDLRTRGLREGPKLAIGDGALGFWAAINEVYPETLHQRCWVHKTANILNKLPKSLRNQAKGNIYDMYKADTKENALKAYEKFIALYQDKYPHAVKCLTKSREQLFNFYRFPAVQWIHIRTTNPIESTFSTVRLRTNKTRGCCSRKTVFTMVFKLAMESQKRWFKLQGHSLIKSVLNGDKYINGVLSKTA
jgi:putative transposase